jgi:hypothetical protein
MGKFLASARFWSRFRARFPARSVCLACLVTNATTSTCEALDAALALVRTEMEGLSSVLETADVEVVRGIVERFDRLGRLATAGWTLAARRGAELEAHTGAGRRNATDWLAQGAGIPFARAQEVLALGEQLPLSPPVQEAFTRGELSMAQAVTIADAVSVSAASGPELLKVAREGSHRELCQRAARIKQAARSREDDRRRQARAFHRRSLRFSQLPEGGVRVQVYLTEDAWARCLAALDHRADVLFRKGRKAKVHATRDQYRADSLVDILTGDYGDESDAAPSAVRTTVTTIVRVDVSALRRGSLEPGEVCEIAGVGPVSVDLARELVGEGYLRLLVTDGTDVTTITGRTRVPPARLEAALLERDPSCVVPGCGVSIGLETHHWQTDVQYGGPTILENLCRICCIHHDLATNGGWRLQGGPGRWQWVGPDWPVSPKLQARRRRVSAHRGRSPTTGEG